MSEANHLRYSTHEDIQAIKTWTFWRLAQVWLEAHASSDDIVAEAPPQLSFSLKRQLARGAENFTRISRP